LSAATLETGDAAYVAKELGVVARAKGMTEIAHKIEFSPEEL
jgi:probable addiction module antidote protein